MQKTMTSKELSALPVFDHTADYPWLDEGPTRLTGPRSEHETLVSSIIEHGLLTPVVIWEGKLLDGRNRTRAIAAALPFVENDSWPVTEFFGTEYEAVQHITALNISRRHMTKSQIALQGVLLLPYEREQAKQRQLASLKQNASSEGKLNALTDGSEQKLKGKAVELVASKIGVSTTLLRTAERVFLNPHIIERKRVWVKDEDGFDKPDIEETTRDIRMEVHIGKITLTEATKLMEAHEKRQELRRNKVMEDAGVRDRYEKGEIALIDAEIEAVENKRKANYPSTIPRWVEQFEEKAGTLATSFTCDVASIVRGSDELNPMALRKLEESINQILEAANKVKNAISAVRKENS